MEFHDVVLRRRSVRQFRPDPVPREILERIVAAGVEAPSGCNMQLRQYVIVDDPAAVEVLRFCSPALRTAPAVIVVLIDPKGTEYGEFWVQDASAAMENMLLAAVAEGYAGCWIEGALRRCEADVRAALGIPENLRVWSLTPIGKPLTLPPRPMKPSPQQVTHYNRFGGSLSGAV